MPRKLDITDCRFTRLVALAPERKDPWGKWQWLCQCDCGRRTIVSVSQLMGNGTRSCGCLKPGNTARVSHGTRERPQRGTCYTVWANMMQRCGNPNHPAFKNYGGRGITVCERWLKFENFFHDMGEPPPGLTLERRNNDLGYFPENCAYATRSEQAQNRRRQCHEKLTPEDVLAIRTDERTGAEIGRVYGISQSNVSLIKRRKAWQHV